MSKTDVGWRGLGEMSERGRWWVNLINLIRGRVAVPRCMLGERDRKSQQTAVRWRTRLAGMVAPCFFLVRMARIVWEDAVEDARACWDPRRDRGPGGPWSGRSETLLGMLLHWTPLDCFHRPANESRLAISPLSHPSSLPSRARFEPKPLSARCNL